VGVAVENVQSSVLAQAQRLDAFVVSRDRALSAYDVEVLPA